MLRIRIEIDNKSPFLRVLSGILYAEEIDTANLSKDPKLLFKCKVRKDDYCLGYSSYEEDEGIPTKLFNCMKPVIDQMLRSYWKGMILDKEDYAWVSLEGDESWRNISDLDNEISIYIKKENL